MKTSGNSTNVKMWLAHPLPLDVKAPIDRLSRADDVARIAIMPDAHLAEEVCVGTVLATRRLIYPGAVGGDIGCGMAAMAFDAGADLLRDENRAGRVLANLPRAVPAMRHSSRENAPMPGAELLALPLSHARLESIRRREGVIQLGTLGRGNHFLEFQSDEEDRLWLMVHSGSRAMGPAIRDFHLQHATKGGSGLRYLDSQSPEGLAYLSDQEWARCYARRNRRAMVDSTALLIKRLFNIEPVDESYFDCDHNHVRRESHSGEDLWVHRKGAASAADQEQGIIPGSMGTESYHVKGRGCAESLSSSSHGAGRAMGRGEAQQKITLRDLDRQLRGIWYDRRIERSLREEAPAAYKDIRLVMRAQRELTRIIRKLRPILSYKAG